MNSKGNKTSNSEWTVGSVLHGYKVMPAHPRIACQAPYSWCEGCSLCKKDGTVNILHWEKILPSGMTKSEILEKQDNERMQRLMMRHNRNLSLAGIFMGFSGILIASLTNNFGFGQIPQLLGGIMVIGGALMALYYGYIRLILDN